MNVPLNPYQKDPIWILYGEVLKVIDSRSFQQELARNGMKDTNNIKLVIKIILLSIFFKMNVSHVYNETFKRSKLRKFLKINYLPELKKIREFYHKYDEEIYLEIVLKTLNKVKFKKIHDLEAIILDSTNVTLDLKFSGMFLTKEYCEDKEYKRGYSTSIKHYAGFQMTLAIDHDTCRPLAIKIYPGSPNDTKLFDDMMNELKRRRILKKGQIILCDKGFYSLENYVIGINTYNVVPLIFPKKKPSILTLMDRIQYPLEYFNNIDCLNPVYDELREKLFNLLPHWEDFKRSRWKIEKVFEFMKDQLKSKCIHAYTLKSVSKHMFLNVLLMGLIVSLGFGSIERIRKLVNFE